MAVDRSYIAANDAARARLEQLVQRASDEQLGHVLPAGWTVAAVLAHLAFWDARALALMNTWAAGTLPSSADHEPDNIDWINDAAKPLCLALPSRIAAQLALDLAAETDHRVAELPEDTLAQLLAIGPPFALSRAAHRDEHLDEIAQALGA